MFNNFFKNAENGNGKNEFYRTEKKMSQTKVINTDRANSPHYYYVFL